MWLKFGFGCHLFWSKIEVLRLSFCMRFSFHLNCVEFQYGANWIHKSCQTYKTRTTFERICQFLENLKLAHHCRRITLYSIVEYALRVNTSNFNYFILWYYKGPYFNQIFPYNKIFKFTYVFYALSNFITSTFDICFSSSPSLPYEMSWFFYESFL